MITEQYVSFDTAKMLKEAGFDVPCDKWSGEEGIFMSGNHKSYKCPTQQLAARWLREVHRIVVDVVFEPPKRGKDWRYIIGNMETWRGWEILSHRTVDMTPTKRLWKTLFKRRYD